MEHIVTLEFESKNQHSAFSQLSTALAYLHENSIILFEEQFDDVDVNLSQEQKSLLKEFSQSHTDF